MAARSWQEALAQQAEEVSARVRDALSVGLGLLRTELGLELGLEPQGLPSWLVLLATAALGLLLLLGLLWAVACATGSRRKQPRSLPGREDEDEAVALGLTGGGGVPNKAAPAALLLLKAEEQKKRNKKRLAEKGAARPNGRPVLDLSEDEIIQTVRRENPKQPLDAEKKNEKSKKNKKKSKGDAKTVQDLSRLDGKEADEGAWETKISNREKRQQRKRDKVLTDAGPIEPNLPGMENAVTVATEQLIPTPSFPVGPRKNKGDTILNVQVSSSKSAKGDSTIQQVSSGLNESPTVNGGNWNEKSAKISSEISAGEEKWTSVPSATAGKRKTETSAWGQDTGDASGNGKDWSVSLVSRSWGERTLFPSIAAWNVDGRIKASEPNSASFTSLGLNPAISGSSNEPVTQPGASDFQWDLSRSQPHVNDEWSGLNGLSSADPSSDWNAPAEEWGNWVDEEKAPSIPQPEEPLSDVQKASDDEREKAEPTLQSCTSGKSKKKKKKKKKQGEEASSPAQDAEDLDREVGEEFQEDTAKAQPQQEIAFSLKTISTSEPAEPEETPPLAVSTEPSVIVSESDSDKISSQVPQMLQETDVSSPNIKQNSVPPPQTKSEDSWESPKQVKKKKKARRET
ncbi:aryl-hydrocarbon-interacting protein-like 1 [Platysternon megacephalum]|uniref:Aryl-hydrocarbon-interacting protein-like 1 n=1 Tax=Platysternon megacephalum TaxID=55544 RepID=A0A4D9E4X0_9SAUR|nr:aryl-hydrocarbon-interacting protein-like 1 [Platysternon megacephalum]